jgi:hypothetical protein
VSNGDVRAAAEAIRHNVVSDPAAKSGTLESPVRVVGPNGELDSWFVALKTSEGLLGFFQLEPDLRLHRYSTFEHPQPGPAWLDPEAIRAHATAAVGEGDELGEPVLTYRGNRDRLAWSVPIQNRPGTVYVVGDYVEVVPTS